jgi:competence ComEA-like helix-hairpin-helix protein
MSWKSIVEDYLTFTRKDRVGILVLLFLMFMVIFLPKFVSKGVRSKPMASDTGWIAAMKRLEQKEPGNTHPQNSDDENKGYQYDRSKNNDYDQPKRELFYFDPNSIQPDGWKKLGLRDKTIHTIQNYLSKGGHFKRPEDLQRIYGLYPDEYDRLAPFIKIESTIETKKQDEFPVDKSIDQNHSSKILSSRYFSIDINTADTTSFIALPGIGSKLAARIINFRSKLGGFYAVAQVGETFALPDSTFQKIKQYLKLENASVKKININTATLDELKAHPYIRWNIANPIIAYRNEHGPFAKLEDIKNVMAVTEEIYNKILPYLSL